MVGEFCREFRVNKLGLTLQEISNKSGINIKTISAFENGRSSNFNHFCIYLNECKSEKMREYFIKKLIVVLMSEE